ncbi:PQQ-binding-like beta-propeller repeat protein [Paenibacillus xylanexedens]|uniref:outer membrane protein assembly factor BamB family protein n=1 Tax=Paenibacillus xylanexedens TaxID=528191 RepID=UPI0011A64A17|nr:PQQ-binding-like beta-propeller repeat protein [Paenibacillus xylanexedens]
MKKRLFTAALILTLLSACGTSTTDENTAMNEETSSEQTNSTESNTEQVDNESSDTAAEPVISATLSEAEDIPIQDYDNSLWGSLTEHQDEMNGRVYEENGIFYMKPLTRINTPFDSTTGEYTWEHDFRPGTIVNPNFNVDDQLIYLTTKEITGLRKSDGKQLFSIDIPEYELMSDLHLTNNYYVIAQQPKGADAKDYKLYAYDRQTNKLAHEQELSLNTTVVLYQFASHGDLLYYVDNDNILTAIDLASGEQVWTQQVPQLRLVHPLVREDHVYVFDYDHTIYSFDATTGEQQLELKTEGSTIGVNIANPMVTDNRAYILSEEEAFYLLSYDTETSQERWRLDTSGYHVFGMYLMEGTLFVLADDLEDESDDPMTYVVKIDPESGEILEKIKLEHKISKGPRSSREAVLTYVDNDRIYMKYKYNMYYISKDI